MTLWAWREMHDGIDAVVEEDAIQKSAIDSVAEDQLGSTWHSVAAAVTEVVEDNDVRAFADKLRGYDASDVAGSSCDENAIRHGLVLCPQVGWVCGPGTFLSQVITSGIGRARQSRCGCAF